MTKRFQFKSKIGFWTLTLVLGMAELSASTITYKYGPCIGVKEISCPSASHILFNLFTKENNSTGHLINFSDPKTLTMFNSSNPTKILIHGFNFDSKAESIKNMVKAYLELGPHNVITADWSSLGKGPDICYPLISKNTESVGKCVADLVTKLGNKTRNVHVIGHSLGARVAGYAANFLKPFVLPRITGLDPVKPMFGKNDLIHKLDSTDADFVDIIHTNIFNQGKMETAGHVDFYVNGGISQPGCLSDKKSKMFGFGSKDVLCSHLRAANYFIESIKSPNGFWGWGCSTLSSAISGSCTINSPAILMGEPVSHKARGIVHVETRSQNPFSLGPWLLGAVPTRPTMQPTMHRPGPEYLWDTGYDNNHLHHESHHHESHHHHPGSQHYHHYEIPYGGHYTEHNEHYPYSDHYSYSGYYPYN